MAVVEFGVTATILGTDCFPNYTFGATSSPTSTRIASIITRRAAEISGRLRALGLDPSTFTTTGEAYQACQRILLAGCAADVALAFVGRTVQDSLVWSWKSEWRDGMKALGSAQTAKALLADAITTSTGGFIRTHIQDGGDEPTSASDIVIDDPSFTAGMDL